MIEMVEPSKALVAKHTLLSFIPIRHYVPDQAVLWIGLNLPQTGLTTVLALRPARALIQTKSRFTDKGQCGRFPRSHIHGFFRERLRAGYESLATVHEIGLHCGDDAGKKPPSHHCQEGNSKKSKYCHKYLPPGSAGPRKVPDFLTTMILCCSWVKTAVLIVTERCDWTHSGQAGQLVGGANWDTVWLVLSSPGQLGPRIPSHALIQWRESQPKWSS